MPQLLVSVRNAVEAIAATEGGADIIDIKEPIRGSLGCAAPHVIREIADTLHKAQFPFRPLSVALGEMTEWGTVESASSCESAHGSSIPRDVAGQQQPELELRVAVAHAAAQFLKLGFANVVSSRHASSWISEWNRLRASMRGQHAWVAVGYADHDRAGAPNVNAVLHAAVQTGCSVLLIDTHTKDGSSLLSWLTVDQLSELRRQTLLHGLKLALAGRVTSGDLPQLLTINSDIIAVRGAVCDRGNRTAAVSKDLVKQFRAAMHGG